MKDRTDSDYEENPRGIREKILEEAAILFSMKEFCQVGIPDVYTEVGCSSTVFEHFFPTKSFLIQSLIEQIVEVHTGFICESVGEGGRPRERLLRLFDAERELVQGYPEQVGVLHSILFGPNKEFRDLLYSRCGGLLRFVTDTIIRPAIAVDLLIKGNAEAMAASMLFDIYLDIPQVPEEMGIWPEIGQTHRFVEVAMCEEDPWVSSE